MKIHKVIFLDHSNEKSISRMTDVMLLPEDLIPIICKQVIESKSSKAVGYEVPSFYGKGVIVTVTGVQ